MIKEFMRRLFDSPTHLPQVMEYDLFNKQSDLDEIIVSQNWHALFDLYQSCSESDRHFLLVHIYQYHDSPVFQQLAQLHPQNYIAHLLLGASLAGRALHLRSGCLASDIEGETWDEIFMVSEKATNALLRALEVNAYDPQVYFPLIQVQTIVSAERDVMTSYLDAAMALTQKHYPLYVSVLNFLTKKWGGSYEEMFSFAKYQSQIERADPCLHGLIALAHIERWLGFSFDEEYDSQQDYFEDDLVQQELRLSYGKLQQNAQQNGFYRTAVNHFAFAFYISGQNDLLKDALLFLDGHYFTRPWCYGASDEANVIYDALKRVGLNK